MATNYLHLTSNPLRFVPASKNISVYFDAANQQMFVVKEDQYVTVVSIDERWNTSIRVSNEGPMISIKLSLDKEILAIQRNKSIVEFFDTTGNLLVTRSCKGSKRSVCILGFHWTFLGEFVFITNAGLELYQILPEKRSLKLIKSYNVSVNWYVYSHENRVLLLSSGAQGNILHPYHFKQSLVSKLPKFEVDLPPGHVQLGMKMIERDISIALIYGRIYCLYIRQMLLKSSYESEVVLYHLTRESVQKKVLLLLEMSGQFAVNVVDNLIVVHHQESRTSSIFDIKMISQDLRDSSVASTMTNPVTHRAVVPPLSIAPFEFEEKLLPRDNVKDVDLGPITFSGSLSRARAPSTTAHDGSNRESIFELYSNSWVFFKPDIVVDARWGCLWRLQLNLHALVDVMSDRCVLIDFLLRRKNSKLVILDVCRSAIVPTTQSSLTTVANIFDQLNAAAHTISADLFLAASQLPDSESGEDVVDRTINPGDVSPLPLPAQQLKGATTTPTLLDSPISGTRTGVAAISTSGGSSRAGTSSPMLAVNSSSIGAVYQIVTQADMYTYVFTPLSEEHELSYSMMLSVLVEYIRSLNQYRLPVQHFFYELVITLLVHHERFYQLHQFLQYHVVNDSKHVACLLLSLESIYPPAYQLALDMLKRLNTANEQIVDVLLSKSHVIPALRFMRSNHMDFAATSQHLLEVTVATCDKSLFFTVYNFILSQNSSLLREDACKPYVEMYQSIIDGRN